MDFFERFLMAQLFGKRELFWGSGAIGAIFFFLCSLALIIYGLVSGYYPWCAVGGITAVVFAILAVVCIALNIRKNTNHWNSNRW